MKRFPWVLMFAAIFLITLGFYISCEYRLRSTISQARQNLITIASNAALGVSAEEVLKVPLAQKSEGTPEYMALTRKLEKVKEANPFVKYAYIMTATEEPGILQYVVDANPVPEIITAHCPTSLPGDKYDARSIPELLNAYDGPSADKDVTKDVWGVFISGYAPIRDVKGKAVAILGVDTDGNAILEMQKDAKKAAIAALCFGLILLISFAASKKFFSIK